MIIDLFGDSRWDTGDPAPEPDPDDAAGPWEPGEITATVALLVVAVGVLLVAAWPR